MARQTVEITQCDRCGRKKCEGKEWYSLWYRLPPDYEPPDFDLCPQCSLDFSNFMKKE